MKYTIKLIILLLLVVQFKLLSQQEQEKLTFSHKRGFYEDTFDLTLSTTTLGIQIKYTKDGTNPFSSPTAIQDYSPVTIYIDPANTNGRDRAPGFCVRAVAIQNDTAATKIKTHSYIFVKRVVELSSDGQRPGPGWLAHNMSGNEQFMNHGMDPQVCNSALYKYKIVDALLDIPTFSMVMDLNDLFNRQTGIYTNALKHGREWERPCSMELLPHEGADDFQINAGVRIRGGYSRHNFNPKRAFRYFFRSEYGEAKLRYPLFGDEGVAEFDKIDLRTSMNYSWSNEGSNLNTMNRDVFSRDAQREMGQPYTRSRYYHLYINGTYFGLYQTQERSEASYASYYFGGNREDYDVVKVATDLGYVIEATDGTLNNWRKLWQLSMEGFESDENYYKAQGQNRDGTRNPDYDVLVDIDNLIDYMLITFLAGDYDGPISNFGENQFPNNFYAIYNRNGQEGFKFFRHDGEHTLRDHPWGYNRTGPFPAGTTFEKSNPQWIHQMLVAHPHYRTRLADHVYKHFFNGGVLTPEANIKRFLLRKAEIELAIIAESARWGDSKHEPAYTKYNAWIPAINWIVNDYFPNRTNIVLGQIKAKGWYPQTSPAVFNVSDRQVPKGFNLSITAPEGKIYYTLDGSDPFQPEDASDSYITVVSENSNKRVLVPTSNIGTNWRSNINFNDSGWRQGTGGVGYERGTGYENYININVETEMVNKQASCYVRIPFTMTSSELTDINLLNLNMRYDDGFVAYLNGTKVAEATNPYQLTWNAAATDNHEAETLETFDISEHINRLNTGENLLAIHGLNISITSSDFIISPELVAANISNEGTISEDAVEYTAPIQITMTSHIKARVLNDKNWSAANEVQLWVLNGLDNLKITEIHYHPVDEVDGLDDDNEYEFIELKNIGSEVLDISNFSFSEGIGYHFPNPRQIQPGEFLVLASNAEKFHQRYGFAPDDEYERQLANSGETIAINTAAGDTLIKIRYNDKYPWPQSADGEGFSLVPIEENPYKDQAFAQNWMASGIIHGTPGGNNVSAVASGQVQKKTTTFHLFQNYPNPFNPTTTIHYELPVACVVELTVYNIFGQEVKTIINEFQSAGSFNVSWDGRNNSGQNVSSGIYIAKLQSVNQRRVKKMILVR